jgi:tRNA U34 5-methylaminomethyl-2-thiouridine-forming methyltransferase MnmC
LVLTRIPGEAYQLVPVSGGALSVRSVADSETFHPGIGPEAEAEALYVRQLRLPERVLRNNIPFVIWDVGFGAAANAVVTIRALAARTASLQSIKEVQLVSFDRTSAAARFALNHAPELGYFRDLENTANDLISTHRASVRLPGLEVHWRLVLGDFPLFVQTHGRSVETTRDPPDAILFDPHSPAKNPEMWTVELFTDLFRSLDPGRSCVLATFTRSTLARAAMLLGGFYVGAGHASGLKEETTMASNRVEELEQPLDACWLERARRSASAEPLRERQYRRAPLSPYTWQRLCRLSQFSNGPTQSCR